MKFYLVPVGQEFNYQGKTYIKTGPLTASPISGDKNRLIPRSAMTEPVETISQPEGTPAEEQYLSKDEVIKTIDNYHNHCLELLEELDNEASKKLRSKLEKYFQEIITTL